MWVNHLVRGAYECSAVAVWMRLAAYLVKLCSVNVLCLLVCNLCVCADPVFEQSGSLPEQDHEFWAPPQNILPSISRCVCVCACLRVCMQAYGMYVYMDAYVCVCIYIQYTYVYIHNVFVWYVLQCTGVWFLPCCTLPTHFELHTWLICHYNSFGDHHFIHI